MKLVQVFLLAGLLLGLFLLLVNRKREFMERSTRVLERVLESQSDLDIHVGKISGNLLGFVSLEAIKVTKPHLPKGKQDFLDIKKVTFQYRFLDFLSKNFSAKLRIDVEDPTIHWSPRVSVRKPSFPFVKWLREWALSHQKDLVVHVDNLTLFFGGTDTIWHGINIDFKNNTFHLELPFSHVPVGELDISCVLEMQGQFEATASTRGDLLSGTIKTERTVVNWRPLSEESTFNFSFSKDRLVLSAPNFLGRIEVLGDIDFSKDYALNLSLQATGYPLEYLDPFLKVDPALHSPGRLDLDLKFTGSVWSPMVEAQVSVHDAWISKKNFKTLDIQGSGVYPTLSLSGSRILLDDGSSMRLGDTTIEVGELFKEKTYKRLVEEVSQNTVVSGPWEFRRPDRDRTSERDTLMERTFDENLRLQLRSTDSEEDPMNDFDSEKIEVGFEYKLKAKNSLKLKVKEEEEFIGVERKMTF